MKLPSLLTALCLATQPLFAAEPAKTAEPRSPRILLQEALFSEEAERDLEKASAGYTEMLAQFETQRTLAATALYHLAEIRAKQKKTAEAIALHQRLVTEFPKEEALAKLSRDRLAALGGSAPVVAAAGADAISAKEAEELARVRKVAKESPDLLNAPDENGHAPIIRAGLAGWIQVSTFLLDNGVNIDGKGGDWVPLGAAARGGHKRLVELLLERGADVNATPRGNGWTALHSASNHNRVEVARVLLEHGAKPNVVTRDPAPFEGPEYTPLLIAIAKQEKEMTALLLEKGADASLASPRSQKTPLVSAMGEDQNDVVNLLLEHNAKVDQPAEEGMTPLIFAAKHNRATAVKALLARKAKVDLVDETGATALHYAAATAEPLVEMLLAGGASPKAVTKSRLTPLLFSLQELFHSRDQGGYPILNAVQQQHLKALPKIWEELIAKGGEINAADGEGRTLLHYACGTSEVPTEHIEFLARKGADLSAKSEKGALPLQFASSPRLEALTVSLVVPKLVKERAITLMYHNGYGFANPVKTEPASQEAEPPKWETILSDVMHGPVSYPHWKIKIYRADAAGAVKEAASTEGEMRIDGKGLPKAQWGDAVIVSRTSETLNKARGISR